QLKAITFPTDAKLLHAAIEGLNRLARIGLPEPEPCLLARRLSPLMAACSSLASVGKVMAFSCTVVSTVTRLRSWPRNAPAGAPLVGSRPAATPACRRAACANGSGPSARAGRGAGKTLHR